METQVRTPQMVFMQPQRLVVPLFQRPYVWNEENQWEPLWGDVARVAEHLLTNPNDRHYPHFLGAVVLQQVHRQTGQLQERTIIDGQQRLTTLQLLLDALHAELLAIGATAAAMRIEPLVANAQPFRSKPEDGFKVWPTNRDRAAFHAVMGAEPPIDYDAIRPRGERMVDAHRFFAQQARQWLTLGGPERSVIRGAAIETAVRELLQVVVIDLAVDENAQEIFETLNARGAQLTAADLIKNFIFQRLLEGGADVESAYERDWKDFETGFWETEISVGRLRSPRSSIFLNHWLIAKTGKEVLAREVFHRFKRFADHEAHMPMDVLLGQVHDAASVYRSFIRSAAEPGSIERLGLFGYRTGVLESEVIKPLVLYLLSPNEPAISSTQLITALASVESWMVRRMLVRATTKGYNQIVAELIGVLRESGRDNAGDRVKHYLASQSGDSRYWPDDDDVRRELDGLLAYRRLGRGRLRMVLEAIEDHKRGWVDGQAGLGGERVARGKLAIEHVMPRKWQAHWPLPEHERESDRDGLIHTLGNLTLLTGKLNTKVSNGPWLGPGGKREGLEAHDVLLLNRDLLRVAPTEWTDDAIRMRTRELASIIVAIWPVPDGHRSGFTGESRAPVARRAVQLLDLIGAGILAAGTTLYPRSKKYNNQVATVLADGRLEVDGKSYGSPSNAAAAMVGHAMNGWWFFLVDQSARRSLSALRRDYINAVLVDTDDDESDDNDDDEL